MPYMVSHGLQAINGQVQVFQVVASKRDESQALLQRPSVESLAILYHKSLELVGKQQGMLFNVQDQWPQGRGTSDGESSDRGCFLGQDLE